MHKSQKLEAIFSVRVSRLTIDKIYSFQALSIQVHISLSKEGKSFFFLFFSFLVIRVIEYLIRDLLKFSTSTSRDKIM